MHRISAAARRSGAALPSIETMLRLVRENLGMDISFVGEFVGERRVFRHVDAASDRAPFRAGDASPLEEGYCARVVDGRLPELIRDAGALAQARALPVTRSLPIGAHLSVPIRLSDGSVFGTFCCFSHKPDPTLNARDLAMLRTFAGLAAQQIEGDRGVAARRAEILQRIRRAIEAGGPSIVYQPVFLVDGLRPVGAEALARFPFLPARTPDVWFAEAGEVGLQVELERLAIRNALAGYAAVWREMPLQLGLNAASATILDPAFVRLFDGYPLDRIVVELTEHEAIGDYAPLTQALDRLRALGIKIAIDDVGAGYSSMSHVVATRPDIMKLDIGLTRSIDADPMKLALATALNAFAGQFNCKVVAEGIETAGELEVLECLKVQAVQGHLLGRPMSADALVASVRTAPPELAALRQSRRNAWRSAG